MRADFVEQQLCIQTQLLVSNIRKFGTVASRPIQVVVLAGSGNLYTRGFSFTHDQAANTVAGSNLTVSVRSGHHCAHFGTCTLAPASGSPRGRRCQRDHMGSVCTTLPEPAVAQLAPSRSGHQCAHCGTCTLAFVSGSPRGRRCRKNRKDSVCTTLPGPAEAEVPSRSCHR